MDIEHSHRHIDNDPFFSQETMYVHHIQADSEQCDDKCTNTQYVKACTYNDDNKLRMRLCIVSIFSTTLLIAKLTIDFA